MPLRFKALVLLTGLCSIAAFPRRLGLEPLAGLVGRRGAGPGFPPTGRKTPPPSQDSRSRGRTRLDEAGESSSRES